MLACVCYTRGEKSAKQWCTIRKLINHGLNKETWKKKPQICCPFQSFADGKVVIFFNLFLHVFCDEVCYKNAPPPLL